MWLNTFIPVRSFIIHTYIPVINLNFLANISHMNLFDILSSEYLFKSITKICCIILLDDLFSCFYRLTARTLFTFVMKSNSFIYLFLKKLFYQN